MSQIPLSTTQWAPRPRARGRAGDDSRGGPASVEIAADNGKRHADTGKPEQDATGGAGRRRAHLPLADAVSPVAC